MWPLSLREGWLGQATKKIVFFLNEQDFWTNSTLPYLLTPPIPIPALGRLNPPVSKFRPPQGGNT